MTGHGVGAALPCGPQCWTSPTAMGWLLGRQRWPSSTTRALELPRAPLLLPVIILCIVEVVIILLLVFLRKRILIAIALIKEASRSGWPLSPSRGGRCHPSRQEDSGWMGSCRHRDFNQVLTIFSAGLSATS